MTQSFQLERFDSWSRRLSRIWLGALWGLAEATVFFLVPDILLTASALFSPKRSLLLLVAILIGSLLGGALLYTASDRYPAETRQVLLNVPFIKTRLLEQAERQTQDHGLWAMFIGAFTGVPYKTYAAAAPLHAPFEMFMALSLPARLARFLVSWGLAALLGHAFRRQIEAAPAAALALLAICWIGFYTYYWSMMI